MKSFVRSNKKVSKLIERQRQYGFFSFAWLGLL